MDILIPNTFLFVSIGIALKRLFSGKVLWGLFSIIFTMGSLIAFIFFEHHRNWVNPPQKELDYFMQKIGSLNPQAYLIVALFVIVICLAIYNWRQIVSLNPQAYLIVALFVIVICLAIYNWRQIVKEKHGEDSFELTNEENENQFELSFWFEHGGFCIWSKNSKARNKYGYPVTNEDLPISKELISELNDLEIRYSRSLDWDDPRSAAPWSIEERESFRIDAHKACEKLAEELGDEYLVFDDVDSCIYDNEK
jgi:hypothetical protein